MHSCHSAAIRVSSDHVDAISQDLTHCNADAAPGT